MDSKTFVAASIKPIYRTAGWSAIASGIVGIAAAGFLVSFLMVREQNFDLAMFLMQFHDGGVSIQFLLWVPVANAFYRLSQRGSLGISKRSLDIGVGSLFLTALFLWLAFPKILSDGLYTLPQGVFGVWLVIANWRLAGLLSKPVRWFGMLIGFGVALVGLFTLSYIILVSPLPLKIPAATIDEIQKIPYNSVNEFLHYFIWIGSFMGVFPLPFWTIVVGWKLLRKKDSIES